MGTKKSQDTLFFARGGLFQARPVLVIIHENASPDTAAVSPRCFSWTAGKSEETFAIPIWSQICWGRSRWWQGGVWRRHAFIHDVAAERCFCLRAENVGQVVRVHVDFLGDGGAAQFRIGKMRTDMNILVYWSCFVRILYHICSMFDTPIFWIFYKESLTSAIVGIDVLAPFFPYRNRRCHGGSLECFFRCFPFMISPTKYPVKVSPAAVVSTVLPGKCPVRSVWCDSHTWNLLCRGWAQFCYPEICEPVRSAEQCHPRFQQGQHPFL